MKIFRSISLVVICIIFSSSDPRLYYNYIQYTSSPNKEYELIAIPESDANSVQGYVFIKSRKDNKVKQWMHIYGFSGSIFVLSNDGNTILKIQDELFGCWDIIDPPYTSTIYAYSNGELTDSLGMGIEKFGFLRFAKDLKNVNFRKKKSFKLSRETISTLEDTLALKTTNSEEGKFYFYDLKAGKFIKTDSKKDERYSNVEYRFECKDVFTREKMISNLIEQADEQ